MRATKEEGEKIINKLKSECNEIIASGMIPTKGLKGGESVDTENAKKALLLIESFEKEFYRKIEQGMVFKKDLPKIEQLVREASQAMARGDLNSAQKHISEANKLTMKMVL